MGVSPELSRSSTLDPCLMHRLTTHDIQLRIPPMLMLPTLAATRSGVCFEWFVQRTLDPASRKKRTMSYLLHATA